MIVKVETHDEHLKNLVKAFECICLLKLMMNPLKCQLGFFTSNLLIFLAHKKGIVVDENNIKAIQETIAPTNKKEL